MGSSSVKPEPRNTFFEGLRSKGQQIGLEPEFSLIEELVTAPSAQRRYVFRENLDRFFFGRGMSVLARLREKAVESQNPAVGALDGLKAGIDEVFQGQFNSYPDKTLPQSEMINTMLRLVNENRTDDIFRLIDENIQHLDGHFFVIISESVRTARAKGSSHTADILLMLARVGAQARLKKGLPCAMWGLFEP